MNILVIRPSPTGEELVNDLNKIGIPSWHFSLFDFYPSFSSRSLSKKINELYRSKIILIFSKKSIYYTNLYLINNNLKWPVDAKYYAIGKSTAFFLYKYIKKKLFFLQK
ncbi:uroporphyrinogen-III synthase [Buchnera aphidicola (Acyrthosiphon lactucae)]|uniref:Uroporphyrinogen-III synthase n=1 Tax=Buchnera aphidicola (Acyrthosiphon lactucae) TaxID=1241832 RepID=A0A4D6XU96_9GAMM|nr:uroporphyrinogen-III synthase [Buchnera aphidicola]QCI17960.1 uroporphyrinogen-III synthase [Buchnera aphidicola (Acyrthosiphon lactucae)]